MTPLRPGQKRFADLMLGKDKMKTLSKKETKTIRINQQNTPYEEMEKLCLKRKKNGQIPETRKDGEQRRELHLGEPRRTAVCIKPPPRLSLGA